MNVSIKQSTNIKDTTLLSVTGCMFIIYVDYYLILLFKYSIYIPSLY